MKNLTTEGELSIAAGQTEKKVNVTTLKLNDPSGEPEDQREESDTFKWNQIANRRQSHFDYE